MKKFLLVLLFIPIIVLSQNTEEHQECEISADSLGINYPGMEVHLGAAVTNMVHVGFRFGIFDDLSVEINISDPFTAALISGRPYMTYSGGILIGLFDDEKYYVSLIYSYLDADTGQKNDNKHFPSINIGWYSSNTKGEILNLFAGFSYLLHNDLEPSYPFFNLGVEIGWVIIK